MCGRTQSTTSSSVVPWALSPLQMTFYPYNHGILAPGSSSLSLFQLDIGKNHYYVRVAATFPNVGVRFLHNFLFSLLALGWFSGVHFTNISSECLYTQQVCHHCRCQLPMPQHQQQHAELAAQSIWDVPGVAFLVQSGVLYKALLCLWYYLGSWSISDTQVMLAGL